MNFLSKIISLIILFNIYAVSYATTSHNIFHYPSTWEIANISENSCVETISFLSDTEVKMASGAERLLATYRVVGPISPDNLFLFTISVNYDNLKPDCKKITANDTGRNLKYYVRIISDKRFLFCENDNLKSCHIRANLYE